MHDRQAFRPPPQRPFPSMQDVRNRRTAARPLLVRQDGAALVTVVFLAAVILTIVVMASRGTQVEVRVAHNEYLAKQALNIAEAGLNHAFSLLKTETAGWNGELSNGGTGGTLVSLGTAAVLNGTTYRFQAFGGGASDGYYVRVVDNYDEQQNADDPTIDRDGGLTLISRGRIGGAERIVQAHVGGTRVFGPGLFGKQYVTMTGGALVDSYDSTQGPYVPATANSNGDVQSNGAISLSGGVTQVNGDVTAGTTISLGSGTISGTQTPNAPPLTFASVPACGPPYSPGAGMTGTGNWTYDSATGALSASGGGSITLANGTYCIGLIKLTGNSTVIINAPVTIFVTGTVDASGGAFVNTTYSAMNLRIFSSYSDLSGSGVKLPGGVASYLGLYAPDTGLSISGGGTVFGAIVAGNVSTSGGATFHYDEAFDTVITNIVLSGWREARGS